MKAKILKFKALSFIFIMVGLLSNAHAYSDQTTTERILKENRYFVNFINVAVTNFAEDKKDIFKEAYEKHFNAELAYLQSDFKRAFKRVYASQGDMVKLYEEILRDYYLEGAKTILDALAPGIIMSKNSRARLYLTLGYRDRTVSWTHYVSGDASNPKLHSYKLYKYEEAIKMARRAKRYGFLALFESQTAETKIRIYNDLLSKEKEEGNLFYNRFIDLSESDMINEVGKTYEDYEKDLKSAQAEGKANVPLGNRVTRRVRFRQEVRVAKYVLNHEFDKAEDIIRKYVDDFNYKLSLSTFNVLSRGGAASSEGDKPAEQASGKKVDYEQYRIHLNDNYQRITRESVLEGFLETVKIEDEVKDEEDRESQADYEKRVLGGTKEVSEEKKDTQSNVPEKKEGAVKKEE